MYHYFIQRLKNAHNVFNIWNCDYLINIKKYWHSKLNQMELQSAKYYKFIFFTRTELKGAFSYNNIFQIYPILGEGYPHSKIQKHFPNYIELRTTEEDSLNIQSPYPELDELISEFAPAITKQDLILNLLTTCSNHLFFKYENPIGTWALPIVSSNVNDYSGAESIWCYPVYGSKKTSENNVIIKYTDTSKFAKIEQVNFRDYFVKDIDPDKEYSGPIKFVSIIDSFLLSFFNLENEFKPIVNQAMYHLKNGVELADSKKTLCLLSLFTSLETMVNLEHRDFSVENCETCGQQKFKISKKFRDYLSKYVSNHPKSKTKFNKLYSLRSKIVHSGEILNSEFLYSEASQETKDEENLKIAEVIQICRLSIINWVTHHQMKKQTDLG